MEKEGAIERSRNAMDKVDGKENELLNLNVGGRLFTTRRKTLRKVRI